MEVRLNPGHEQKVFAELVRDHCGVWSNPRLATDDVMALTIAMVRAWPLAMRDDNATRLVTPGVRCITAEELLGGPERPRLPGI